MGGSQEGGGGGGGGVEVVWWSGLVEWSGGGGVRIESCKCVRSGRPSPCRRPVAKRGWPRRRSRRHMDFTPYNKMLPKRHKPQRTTQRGAGDWRPWHPDRPPQFNKDALALLPRYTGAPTNEDYYAWIQSQPEWACGLSDGRGTRV